ncbi:MAG: hypothetical protein JST00_04745 [Deltaproteobacteria bacterium]|nr:hypothetical protein [Deltaproteobacteria bacterium]
MKARLALAFALAVTSALPACAGEKPATTPAEQDPIPLVGPPAGVAPCAGDGAADAKAAALACYESRVKPALAALVKSPRLSQFSFGDADFLKKVVTLTPDARVEPQPRMPESDAKEVATTAVMGDRGSLGMTSNIVQVTLVLRPSGAPADGAMKLAFFVNGKTFETLFVSRFLGG